MSRLTAGKISEQEARRVLQPFGPVECVWWSSRTEREMYQLPEGVWVKFAYFQDWLDHADTFNVSPDLSATPGYQIRKPATKEDSVFFLALGDTEPDAWGRRVIADDGRHRSLGSGGARRKLDVDRPAGPGGKRGTAM